MSGKIPKAFIDEVLERTSLVDYIDSHVSLSKRGKNYLACCPFHNEKTPSFNVIPDKQFYYCFGCGASGNAISFAMNYLQKDFISAIEDLASHVGLAIPQPSGVQAQQQNTAKHIYGFLDEVNQKFCQKLKDNDLAKNYLVERGISAKTIEHFQLGFAPNDWHFLTKIFPKQQKALLETGMLVQNDKGNIYDRYRNRVMFPIHDKRGRVVAFGGRVINPDDKPKYLNSPETPYFHKSKELYGLNHLIKLSPEAILVVEGYMDVIALFEHGIENAVATLGTATSQHHIHTLFKTTKKIIFCFDGDQAGKKAASRALSQCLPIIGDDQEIHFMFLEEGQDPDSIVKTYGKDGFIQRIEQAQSLYTFFFSELKQQANSTSPEDRSKLFHIAKPMISTMQPGGLKELFLNQLALLSRIDRAQLDKFIANNIQLPAPTTVTNNRPKPSAMRTALALLIQQPELYAQIKISLDPQLLDLSENPILMPLIKIISQQNQTTAQLIEHWRNDQHYTTVCKLAALPLNIPQEGKLAELEGALQQIAKKTLQTQIDRLLYKSNTKNLSIEEKHQLQKMIKQKKSLFSGSTQS